jgi:sulfate transport system substrate-binding protein
MKKIIQWGAAWLWLALGSASPLMAADSVTLLNVSYDPTREFYEEYNPLFAKHWLQKTGQEVMVKQSHGGSGKQSRSVMDGLQADVVTLALGYDIDILAEKAQLLPKDWQSKLPHQSCPYTSRIVFLVRKGNPKQIQDWDDLVRDEVKVITPNPKTSGGARWNHLAAYGYALAKYHQDSSKARGFLKRFYANVPVLDTGARGSAMTFTQRGIGDVLVTWENEAAMITQKRGGDAFTLVVPSVSIKAEPPVAVVEKNAIKKGTLVVSQEYLRYLYSPEAQKLAQKHYYQVGDTQQKDAPTLLTIADFGGWKQAQHEHFDDGGVLDQVMSP